MTKSKIFVSSEIAPLKRVIIHCPDDGINRISPKRAEELLFDDIVYLPQMKKEHKVFSDILKMFLGDKNVLETAQLLEEALDADSEKRSEFLKQVYDYEELPQRDMKLIEGLSTKELTDTLITGHCGKEDIILFDPIPNFLFTRDIAVTINDHVLITKASKQARFRENLLTRYIFWAHPMFQELQKNNRIINMNNVDKFPPSRKGEAVSVEGGDVMIINENYLLIGCSERTTAHAIQLLKDELFERNVVNNVVQINISSARSWMHIDTVFTHINDKHFAAYGPLVLSGLATVEVFRKGRKKSKHYSSVKDFLREEINEDMDFVLSGNGISPHAEREQWTDGCNLVALKPGVALTYDRNEKTAEAFKEKGYTIMPAKKLLKLFKAGKIKPEEVENTIITLPSGELSRARGGSHCMTCPIERG